MHRRESIQYIYDLCYSLLGSDVINKAKWVSILAEVEIVDALCQPKRGQVRLKFTITSVERHACHKRGLNRQEVNDWHSMLRTTQQKRYHE